MLRHFLVIATSLLLPTVIGCAAPPKYTWPEGKSPNALMQRLKPGMPRDEVRSLVGEPHESIDTTHTWYPNFYVNAKKVTEHSACDIFWISGMNDAWRFTWEYSGPQLTQFKLTVTYGAGDRMITAKASNFGKYPDKPR